MRLRRQAQSGYTLVSILAVLAIMVMASIIGVSYIPNENDRIVDTLLDEAVRGVELYSVENGQFPNNLTECRLRIDPAMSAPALFLAQHTYVVGNIGDTPVWVQISWRDKTRYVTPRWYSF